MRARMIAAGLCFAVAALATAGCAHVRSHASAAAPSPAPTATPAATTPAAAPALPAPLPVPASAPAQSPAPAVTAAPEMAPAAVVASAAPARAASAANAPAPTPAPAPAPAAPKSPVAAAKPVPAPATRPVAPPAAPTTAPAAAPAAQMLDLTALEQRLRDTRSIGLFTKLSLKNQVDDLLAQFRAYYAAKGKPPPTPLRQRYDGLLLKVITLLQDGDPPLASAVNASREAIWGILADPDKLSKI